MRYLVEEWHYPGIEAAMSADASIVIPIVEVYEALHGEQKPVPVEPSKLKWAPAEHVKAGDLTREQILAGVPGA